MTQTEGYARIDTRTPGDDDADINADIVRALEEAESHAAEDAILYVLCALVIAGLAWGWL